VKARFQHGIDMGYNVMNAKWQSFIRLTDEFNEWMENLSTIRRRLPANEQSADDDDDDNDDDDDDDDVRDDDV
jgi:hypothetical protein